MEHHPQEECGALPACLILRPFARPVSGKAAFRTRGAVVVCIPLRACERLPAPPAPSVGSQPCAGASRVGTHVTQVGAPTPCRFQTKDQTAGAHRQREAADEKLERRRNSWSFEAEAGPGGHGGPLTVICLHKRGFCHPVSDTPGRQRRFRSEAALSPRRRARRAAQRLCFQMKLCAWGLLDLGLIHASLFAQPSRPHPRSPSLLGTEWGLAALPGS